MKQDPHVAHVSIVEGLAGADKYINLKKVCKSLKIKHLNEHPCLNGASMVVRHKSAWVTHAFGKESLQAMAKHKACHLIALQPQ